MLLKSRVESSVLPVLYRKRLNACCIVNFGQKKQGILVGEFCFDALLNKVYTLADIYAN